MTKVENKPGMLNRLMSKFPGSNGEEELEFEEMESLDSLEFPTNNYQLPEALNNRLMLKAEEMNLDSCELMKLILDMALNKEGDLRIDYIEAEKEKVIKYFNEREEVTLGEAVVFYDNIDVVTDINVEEDKFNLIITFKQGTNKVARQVVKPIEDFLE